MKSSSDRSFGFVFAVVFALVAVWSHIHRGAPLLSWAAATSGLFFVVAVVRPGILAPLNRLWTRFGLLLNTITSPIILGIFFFGIVTPIALTMRLFGKRPLQLTFDRQAASYWILRSPPGPPPDSMKQQF